MNPHAPALALTRLLKPLALAIFVAGSFQLSAATLVWNNLSGGTWSDTNNWTPNQLPTANDDVYITNVAAFTVTISSPANVSNLFIGHQTVGLTNRIDQNTDLTVHGVALLERMAWFRISGTLNVSNRFENGGFVQWLDSQIRGYGRFINQTGGVMHTRSSGASTIAVKTFENSGYFLVGSDDTGVFLASNVTFTNHPSGEVVLDLPAFGIQNATGATGTLFVNEGLVRATDSVPSGPSYLTVDLINYGTLRVQTGGWYIGSGTNYGVIEATSPALALSTVSTDPFVLEAGTSFGAIVPKLFAGGQLVVNTPLTINTTTLHVGDGSGGATTSSPKLVVNADLVVTGAVDVTVGRIELLNPNANVFFKSLQIADSGVIGESRYITNAAALTVNSFLQNAATTDNAGSITIRSNLNFTTGNFRTTGGVIVLGPNSSSTIGGTSGKTLNGQVVTNLGTVTASDDVTMTAGATWWNEAGSTFSTTGGMLSDSGTAGFFYNRGTVTHPNSGTAGGVGIAFTNNSGLISCVGSTLNITRGVQAAGRTELRGGALGGTLTLLGGTLDGGGNVGTVINGADVLPGNPLGTIRPTGNFTNLSAGTFHMQIAGITTNLYDRILAAGTADLAGTLQITFTNGFYPVVGNTFTAMTWTARSGVFNTISSPNYEFEVSYTANALLLRASNSLPIMTLFIPAGGTQLVCHPFTIGAGGSDLDGAVTNLEILVNGLTAISKAGASASNNVDFDFPQFVNVVARGIDDRGGYGFATQHVSVINYPLTNVLFPGGVRTNDFKLCLVGEPGRSYEVYASTNLIKTNWVDLGTMTESNGTWRYVDPATLTNRPQRYYRAKQLP